MKEKARTQKSESLKTSATQAKDKFAGEPKRLATIAKILCESNERELVNRAWPTEASMVFDASVCISKVPDPTVGSSSKTILTQLCGVVEAVQILSDYWSECRIIGNLTDSIEHEDYGLLSGSMNSGYEADIPARLESCGFAAARINTVVRMMINSLTSKQENGFCAQEPEYRPLVSDSDRPEALTFLLTQIECMCDAVRLLCDSARQYSLVGSHQFMNVEVPYLAIGATAYLSDTPADYDAVQEDVEDFLEGCGPVGHTLAIILGRVYVSLCLLRWLESQTEYLRVDPTRLPGVSRSA